MTLFASRLAFRISFVTRRMPPFWADFAIFCVMLVLTMLMYGPSLAYPFAWYEADDLSRALRYSPLEYFAGMRSYEYYRPLMFLFWRGILSAWGPDSAPIFHLYSVSAHLLNATLIFALARALTRIRAIAWAAAFLLVTSPFSYQAITWSTAHFHPTVTLLMLVSLLVYIRARLIGARWPAYALSGVILAAAILVHETAFAGMPILVLAELYLVVNRRVARLSLWLLLHVTVTLAALGLYAIVPKSPPAEETFQITSGLYILQGLIYPVAMILARVCEPPGCNSVALILPATGLALLALFLMLRSRRAVTLGLLGLAWYILGAAPVWAGRDYRYIEYAPRLLYFAGAGTALALAAMLDTPDGRARRGSIVRIGAIALIVLQSSAFVVARQPLYADGFRVVEQENRVTFAPRQEMALFINTVDLQSYSHAEFPLGWFGVLVAPWHNRLGQVSHVRAENAEWVILPDQAQQLQERSHLKLEFHGRIASFELMRELLAHTGSVYQLRALAPLPPSELHLFKIAEIDRDGAPQASSVAEWLDAVRLVSASIELEADTPVLNLDWAIDGPIDPGMTVFVHVLDAAGEIVAQADGDLVAGVAPLSTWPPGNRILERRPLDLPAGLPAGTYTVTLGLYDRPSLQRAIPTSVHGVHVIDNALVVAGFEHR